MTSFSTTKGEEEKKKHNYARGSLEDRRCGNRSGRKPTSPNNYLPPPTPLPPTFRLLENLLSYNVIAKAPFADRLGASNWSWDRSPPPSGCPKGWGLKQLTYLSIAYMQTIPFPSTF
ncbi:hypothetical protein AMTR_s00101p00059650 [Amborella trichopoda]|uniref:Uncharacterized protein n=1 Tax=Amborella trichopoda TaxID=13333 RepID=W1NQ48_AMBTC|nr:hypothetical protein AMTR_s00101p00059650 [Amborella trichopoda]